MYIFVTTMLIANAYFIYRGVMNYMNNSPAVPDPQIIHECMCQCFAALGYHHARLLNEINEKILEAGCTPEFRTILKNIKDSRVAQTDFVDVNAETYPVKTPK